MTVTAGVVPDSEGAEASLRDVLAAALDANREMARLAAELREENGRLREENARLRAEGAEQAAELERLRADLAVLQRMVFGRSSERARPEPSADGGGDAGQDRDLRGSGTGGKKRGPGARAGRRDYSHLPRVEVVWDFEGGGYCCPECGTPFTGLGSDHVAEQLDWLVIVRVRADCRRRYRRACSCRVPATATAPGPPKAIGKGLFTNAFIAMLFTERFVAGRSMNSLVTGLARQGADVAPGTLAGACAQAGALLAPLEDAITARSRRSWHLHADETTWRVFAPSDGDGPARWWLWVFLGADTACFVMDATRSGAVLARHAGIDEKTGQLTPDDDDGGPRRLVISSDFYAVYQSAGKKAGGLVNLYCWAHIRRYFVRAGDANPAQLGYWTAAWLELIRDLYATHAQLMTAWAQAAAPAPREAAAAAARLEEAGAAWDEAITVIDEARKKQMTAPGLQEPAKKALATLDREWDGLTAHRDYPMIGLDNNPAERALRRPVVTRKNAYGSRNEDAARLAARIWTVTATAQMAGLNVLTYLTAYLDECGRNHGKPLAGPDLERFLPSHAGPGDLRAWAQPPPPG
ncbi:MULTISPECIES: IS66 family transposase [unclassified Pseudofrankia]|uniref:IS66 family transposase n=1 Tax=unclassified Pseudofrankia TaxID=2994372 RepID=UPI0009135ACD|nr:MULTISPECIES: IS66 family transposase [unclassified Pseudofrankia]MDT3446516.1 IS66 family transposase [Pseudofrankia sp. BMG5.37]OHV55770.1 transposase [Pseudofrankia sp. BMG5.36]